MCSLRYCLEMQHSHSRGAGRSENRLHSPAMRGVSGKKNSICRKELVKNLPMAEIIGEREVGEQSCSIHFFPWWRNPCSTIFLFLVLLVCILCHHSTFSCSKLYLSSFHLVLFLPACHHGLRRRWATSMEGCNAPRRCR